MPMTHYELIALEQATKRAPIVLRELEAETMPISYPRYIEVMAANGFDVYFANYALRELGYTITTFSPTIQHEEAKGSAIAC